jgi:hypothetical protein
MPASIDTSVLVPRQYGTIFKPNLTFITSHTIFCGLPLCWVQTEANNVRMRQTSLKSLIRNISPVKNILRYRDCKNLSFFIIIFSCVQPAINTPHGSYWHNYLKQAFTVLPFLCTVLSCGVRSKQRFQSITTNRNSIRGK